MDDVKFFAIANKFTQLSNQYTTNVLKHYSYVSEYDKLLEAHSLTKQQWVEEVQRRSNPNYQPEQPKAVPIAKPVAKKRVMPV